jgi:hypothetical protein
MGIRLGFGPYLFRKVVTLFEEPMFTMPLGPRFEFFAGILVV